MMYICELNGFGLTMPFGPIIKDHFLDHLTRINLDFEYHIMHYKISFVSILKTKRVVAESMINFHLKTIIMKDSEEKDQNCTSVAIP